MFKRGIDVNNSCSGAEVLQAKKYSNLFNQGGDGGE